MPGDVRCSLLCSSNEFGLAFVGCSKGVYFIKYLPSITIVHTRTTNVCYIGVHVFKTSILYEIDKDDSIGATNVIGKEYQYQDMTS